MLQLTFKVALVLSLGLAVYSSSGFATTVQRSHCQLMDDVGTIYKAIPLCFADKNQGAQLFRWLFEEKSDKLPAEQWHLILKNLKGKMAAADYFLFKGAIYGMDQKKLKSLHYYRKSADLGNAEAAYNVSRRLIYESKKESLKYLHRSADLGFYSAQYILGVNLLYGMGMKKNIDKAITYLENAAKQGDHQALTKLLGMEQQLGKESFIFWQVMNRIILESDGETVATPSLLAIKSWPDFCAKLAQVDEVLTDMSEPSETSSYDTLMQITYNCLTDFSGDEINLFELNKPGQS
jgi:hypothetical protein